MEVVNPDEGNGTVCANLEDRTWYRWYRFPLLPIYGYKPANKWNCADWHFSWLNIRIWSMMSPDIGAEVMLEDTGAYLKLHVPYHIIVIHLLYFPFRWHQKTWRKGTGRDEDDYADL